jgi:hypothetical protein
MVIARQDGPIDIRRWKRRREEFRVGHLTSTAPMPWTAGNNVSPATTAATMNVRHLDQHRGALRPRIVPHRRTRRESGAVGDLIGGLPWRRLTTPLSAR